MYYPLTASYTCADFGNFEQKGLKIFLLNLREKYQKLVKKFQAKLKI